jgi:hypothetical protein
MNRAVLIFPLLALAGCASAPDKQAALDAGPVPMVAQVIVAAPPEPVAKSPVRDEPSTMPAIQATPVQSVAVVSNTPVGTAPLKTAEPEKVSGAPAVTATRALSDSPWNDLTRRVTAWANPLRRSMEPYCQDGQVRKP